MTERPQVHVVYEHDPADPGAFGSAHLRLLRPLTHPVNGAVQATFGTEPPAAPPGGPAGIVVFDRLWHAGVGPDEARAAVSRVRELGWRVVYAVDDNLLDVAPGAAGLVTDAAAVSATFAECADGLLVTTAPLAARYGGFGRPTAVVANALDERLLVQRWPAARATPFGRRPLVVGYMGTRTHAGDLALVEEALRAYLERHPDTILELIGGADGAWESLGTSLARRAPPPGHDEYPLFMRWWTADVRWDIALAPLEATPFAACKSDVKSLEYAAVAAAGIFSAVPPYDSAIADGATGLLVENTTAAWLAALERLTDDDVRAGVAEGARRRLWEGRLVCHTDGVLARTLMSLGGAAP